MPRLWLGVLAGVLFGGFSVATMLPLPFPDKPAALLGAFLNRFSIGVAIGVAVGSPQLRSLSPVMIGVGTGLLLSVADAVITKAYVPILVLGAIGGAAIGWVVGRYGV
jgi:hypothetical protein